MILLDTKKQNDSNDSDDKPLPEPDLELIHYFRKRYIPEEEKKEEKNTREKES